MMQVIENPKENMAYLSEEKKLKEEYNTATINYDNSVEYIKRLVKRFGTTAIIVNRLDYYGNAIPIGAFCNAIAFILYGFHRCKVFSNSDSFLWGIIFLFGGIGQITAGFFELLKGRSFPSTLYLTYGFYCLSHFALYIIPFQLTNFGVFGFNYDNSSLAFFFGAWFFITIPLVICSLQTNLFFLIQTSCTVLFYFFRWVGETRDNNSGCRSLRTTVSGMFEVIAGFISFYICINQLVNEQYRSQILPSFSFNDDNEIDIIDKNFYQTPQE